MADIHRFSERVIDLAQRLENVADAAQGKGNHKSGVGSRWLLLPAAGAGLYALATNNSFGRHAKGVLDQAKARASELPDDLMSRVRQTSGTQPSGTPARKSTTRRSGSRRTTSARKSSSSR